MLQGRYVRQDVACEGTALGAHGVEVPARSGVVRAGKSPWSVGVVHAPAEHRHLARVLDLGPGFLQGGAVYDHIDVQVSCSVRGATMARQVLLVERLAQILVLLVLVGRLIESAGRARDRTRSTGRHTRPGPDA